MVWIIVVVSLLLTYGLYTLLPELLFHIWHLGTFHRGNTGLRSMTLTFDDGPHPEYTPQVLAILKEHDIHATFFLVAERAAKYPQLVQAMIADGHEIASHSYLHKHAWLRDPVNTWLDIRRSAGKLADITGQPIRYYRPPWGAFNWATRLSCWRLKLTPVLWSARAMDWYAGDYADEIVSRVVHASHPGAIVLCHDAGGAEGAPRNTIGALPNLIQKCHQLGYTFVTVGEMETRTSQANRAEKTVYHAYPRLRRILITVWKIVEFSFEKIYHIVPVNQIFRVSPTTWHHGPRYGKVSEELEREHVKRRDLRATDVGLAEAKHLSARVDHLSADWAGSEHMSADRVGANRAGSEHLSANRVGANRAGSDSDQSATVSSHPREALMNEAAADKDDIRQDFAGRNVVVLQNGAKALDLHFRNEALISMSGDNRNAIRGLKAARNGFGDVARLLAYHPAYQDVEVLMAVTLMNRGIEMLGFHVEELPDSGEKRRLQRYMRFLMGMYHPDGFARLRQGKHDLSLKLIWMTRDELIDRYGDSHRGLEA